MITYYCIMPSCWGRPAAWIVYNDQAICACQKCLGAHADYLGSIGKPFSFAGLRPVPGRSTPIWQIKRLESPAAAGFMKVAVGSREVRL
jgi:hypothetical protein